MSKCCKHSCKCGCGCGCGCNSTVVMPYNRYGNDPGCGNGNNGFLWIIILLAIFCGNGNGFGSSCGNNCDDDDCCDGNGFGNNGFLWIIILLAFCGNGFGGGCGNGGSFF